MNWKSTVVLLAVALALLAFFKFYEVNQTGTKVNDDNRTRLVIMDRNQMGGLTITDHDLKVDLRRNDAGEWLMKSPIADRADVSLINELMSDLETARIEDTIPASDIAANKTRLQDFGLQAPRLRLQVTPMGGKGSAEFAFGNETAIQGKTYLQVGGRNEVYVVDSALKKILDKDVNAWRDHRVIEMAATDVNKLAVKNAAGEMELQRFGEHWQITKPLNARGTDQRINDLVSQITNLTVGSFVADDKADAATYGLADPRGVVTLFTAKDVKGTELIIGSPKMAPGADQNNPAAPALPSTPAADGSVYLRMPSRQSIYTVAKGVEDFLNLKPNDVRDRSLIRLNPDLVDRIHVTSASGEAVNLTRKDKAWTMLGSPSDQPANPGEAIKLMQDLSQATASAFVADTASDLAKYGLDTPRLKVTFSSFASENTAESTAGEKPIVTVDFGRVEEPNVYVRVEEEPFVVSVPRSVMDAVPVERAQWQLLNLFDLDPEKIDAISVAAQGKPEVAVTRADKTPWTLAKGIGPLDQSKTQSVANTLAKLHAVRWVSSNLPPGVGLDSPPFAVLHFSAAGSSPTQAVLTLGHTGPENMGYARIDGKPGTFLLSRPDYDTLLQPLVPEASPTPTPATTPTVAASPLPSSSPGVLVASPTSTPTPISAASEQGQTSAQPPAPSASPTSTP